MSLFGSSGIRGKINEELSPQFCLEIAQAIGVNLPLGSTVGLATDTRTSGDFIKGALVSGLLSSGVSVVDLGILPTPALAWLTRELNLASGIMITASHNPPEFNGIKLFNLNTLGYSREQEGLIESSYYSHQFRFSSWEDCGTLTRQTEGATRYQQFLQNKFSGSPFHNLKVLLDPGNGAASIIAPALFGQLGFDVIVINDTPDGHFPGRVPEPTEQSLSNTIACLREEGAELAICFDGDADRVVFADRQGFLGYQQMIAFISRLAIMKSQNKKAVTTVETGRFFDLALADLGVEILRVKVGDVAVAQSVFELNATIGVEPVGVYIFPEIGYYPDSFFASLFLLKFLKGAREIREFSAKVPPLFFDETKILCPNNLKSTIMEAIAVKANDIDADYCHRLDGLRFEWSDAWLLIRPSGTEPIIRVTAESPSWDRTERLLELGSNRLREAMDRFKNLSLHVEKRR